MKKKPKTKIDNDTLSHLAVGQLAVDIMALLDQYSWSAFPDALMRHTPTR